MKISIFYLGKKGAGSIYSLEMAKALSKFCTVQVVVASESKNIQDWRNSGLNLVELDTYNEVHTIKYKVMRIKSTLNVYKFINLKKIIDDFNPDFIYHTMSYPWVPIINILLSNRKKIFTIHDPVMHMGEYNFILKKIGDISRKQADKIIILSDVFINILLENGVDKDKIIVIPHGNFNFYKDKSVQINNEIKKTLLFFGRIVSYKGIAVLLDAFKIIKNDIKDAKLIIAGEGSIDKYKHQLDTLDGIELINRWIDDDEIGSIFGRADYVVVPYIDASQSGVIPLAYTFGLPAIASNIGGIPEQIVNNQTGFLVNPGSVSELAERCIYLLRNPELTKEMGVNAKEMSETNMSWNRCAQRLINSLETSISTTDNQLLQ